MFENPKALEDISQGCEHPLPVIVNSPRGNDEQCEHDSQYVQHIVPFSYNITATKECKNNAVKVQS